MPPTHRLISTQVDRAAFAPAGHDDRAFDDAPLRAAEAASGCVVHLSAPSIYAARSTCVEINRCVGGAR